jgi:AbrB family looped-hinge helix DNA binding protein
MPSRVGPKGQVVIPKALRDQVGIMPGDEVSFSLEDGAIRVEPAPPPSSLRGRYAGLDLADGRAVARHHTEAW